MRNFKSKILGFLVGLSAVAGLAVAANTFYTGYNPNTNQLGQVGLMVAGGPVPVITGTCGTIPAAVGGTSTFQVKAPCSRTS